MIVPLVKRMIITYVPGADDALMLTLTVPPAATVESDGPAMPSNVFCTVTDVVAVKPFTGTTRKSAEAVPPCMTCIVAGPETRKSTGTGVPPEPDGGGVTTGVPLITFQMSGSSCPAAQFAKPAMPGCFCLSRLILAV